jgi:cold shock protein
VRGVVKKWVADRGYGFVKTDAGDVFVHYRALRGMEALSEGDLVEFDKVPGRDAGKWQAANVRLVPAEEPQPWTEPPVQVSEGELLDVLERSWSNSGDFEYGKFCEYARAHGWISG